jgi:hypothetical protein
MDTPLRYGEKPVRLIHLNFNCLRARRYSVVPPVWLVAAMPSLLSRGHGEMPGNPEVVLYVACERDGAQFFVAIRGHELVTGGVAWGCRDRRGLYAFLVGCYEQSKGSSFPDDRPMPSSLPWLGTVGTPTFARLPRRLQAMLLASSRQIAVAIMCHVLATN